MDGGVCVAGEEGGEGVPRVPAVEVGEVAVGVVGGVVGGRVGEFPFFDCVEGGDVEAGVEGKEGGCEGG